MSNVRVRFAPSPTGFFHIGSARTALFNWLYARHTNGTFILRIEDTDKERNSDEFLQVIYNSLRWLGLDWDEGPQVGGDYGPYLQSQRNDIYQKYLKILADKGRTYEKDGAIWFKLEGERYTEYDEFAKKDIEKVRAKPQLIHDMIRGDVERAEDRDFVIYRANGEPVFHFVNVVDDIAMKITHVIRGEDHLSNTSKHCELFRAFGVEPPVFAHIPLILKQEGSGKMSKRDRGALIEEYQKDHYLPAAVRNYLCMLGWSPKDDREIMDIGEIIELFDFPGIQQKNARFDEKKMAFFNSEYVKALPLETLAWLARPILTEAGSITENTDEDYFQEVLMVAKPKISSLKDLPALLCYFFNENYATVEDAKNRVFKKGDPIARLTEALPALERLNDWTEDSIHAVYDAVASEKGQKNTDYFPVTRLAVSGLAGGPDLMPTLRVLGKEKVIARIRNFLEKNK